jgi:hypothetical protein
MFISIEEHIDWIDQQFHTCRFCDQDEYAHKDLSAQVSDLLWIRLCHDVLLHLPRDQQAKNQMIDTCRYYYREYLKKSRLRNIINKALRTEDIDQLCILRYFLGDLIEHLTCQHQQIIQSGRENLIICQEMKLSKNELHKLKEDEGKLMSMKRFLMATTERS